MSRSNRRSVNQNSHFEKNFIVQNAFKRNKRYFDRQKLDNAENMEEMSRRRPRSNSQKSIDQKINSSFMNTTAAFSDKVEQEIGKFKLRMSNASGNDEIHLNQSSRTSRSYSSQSDRFTPGILSARSLGKTQQMNKKKIRGVALDKYCSRQQYYQSKNKPVLDQRLFNNYQLMQPDQKHTRDFDKYLERDLDFSYKNFHGNHFFYSKELSYNTQKLYEDYYYKKTNIQCNFKYKRNTKSQREFYTTKRKQDEAATELCPQKVKKSYQKCSTTGVKNIQGFYANSGRQLPSQLDQRFCNNLTNQWVDKRGKIVRKTKQYSLRKMKNDLIQVKLGENQARKNPTFQRMQLCDSKYFRVHPIE